MAHDPCHNDAAERIQDAVSTHLGDFIPVTGTAEYELKLGWENKGAVRFLKPVDAVYKFAEYFNRSASPGQFSRIDPLGLQPNDYVLLSFQFDTFSTLPTAEFFLHNMQYRLRGPLAVHNREFWDTPVSFNGRLDANIKTLLSKTSAGQHRLEIETVITDPYDSFNEFKRECGNLPQYVYGISQEALRMNAVCMTSRTGWFMVTKVPDTNAYAVVHGVLDCSGFTSPAMETFTERGKKRWEIELEVKGFLGDAAGALTSEDAQRECVNRLFAQFSQQSAPFGFFEYDASKLEQAMTSVEAFYDGRVPANNMFHRFASDRGMSNEMAYAITNGPTLAGLFNGIKERQHGHSLIQLARSMPNGAKMLDAHKFCPDLALAA